MFDLARSLQLAHQPLSRFVNRARIANERDDVVERVDRFRESFENVRAARAFAQLVLGPLAHDLATKLDESLEHLLEVQDARLTIYDREIDHAKRRLHRRQLVSLLSTTCGTASRFNSTTMRMPVGLTHHADRKYPRSSSR
jgi:hypothetical protein